MFKHTAHNAVATAVYFDADNAFVFRVCIGKRIRRYKTVFQRNAFYQRIKVFPG